MLTELGVQRTCHTVALPLTDFPASRGDSSSAVNLCNMTLNLQQILATVMKTVLF